MRASLWGCVCWENPGHEVSMWRLRKTWHGVQFGLFVAVLRLSLGTHRFALTALLMWWRERILQNFSLT